MATKKPADLTTRVLVEIREELKGHRVEFVEIREELKAQRAEHGAQLTSLGATMTQVLKAVQHGNAQRDARVFDHEARISRIEEHIGIEH